MTDWLIRVFLAAFLVTICVNFSLLAQCMPTRLRCESDADPLGIDTTQPRLSWNIESDDASVRGLRQTSYQVLAATSPKLLAHDEGDLWNSGRVESGNSTYIPYAGKPLASSQLVFWKVRIWDNADVESVWSPVASWTMGQLDPEHWQPAHWISAPAAVAPLTSLKNGAPGDATKNFASMLLRSDFICKPSIKRAVVFVSGLGHYELSINGKKVGVQLIAPGWTNYRKTVLYDTFDISNHVRVGENAIGLILGSGMYHIEPTRGRYVKFTNSFGSLKAIAKLQIEYSDGTIQTVATDGKWQVAPGPITYCNVFGGEDYDRRFEPAGWDTPGFAPVESWPYAIEVDGPGGALRGHSAAAPPIQAIETRHPTSENKLSQNVTVYDLGQNASFMPRLIVHGPAGAYVRVIPSELLGANGFVDRSSCVQDAGGPAWWQYTLAGTGEERYFPKFFYQGCRYLQVERYAAVPGGELPIVEAIEGVVVHSSAEPIGTFKCSNELFNKIYSLVRWAQRSNMMSLMTDCPQREKLGWLEELHLNGPALRYNFALENLYAKQMNDMADSQFDNGLVPNIAPEYFIASTTKISDPFRNSPEWGSSFVIAPWQQYLFTGDTVLLHRHYPDMVRYVEFLAGTAKDDSVTVGLGDWYDIGPKPPWGSQLTPPPFTATAIYYLDNCILGKIAELLGKLDDAERFRRRADRIRTAFNKRFFDPSTSRYATGSQCTSAMPLVLGLIEPEHREGVLKALIDDIRSRGNALSAGDVGYRYVLRTLADADRSDIVFEMNNQTEHPGYGMQIKKGATSLTEKWDATVGSFGSQNHFMLGQINEWLFHDLAGIQPDPTAPGFKKIVIKPAIVGDIEWLRCEYRSVQGKISVEWRREGDNLQLTVTIPPNTSAMIYVPTTGPEKVTESGRPVEDAPGVKYIRTEANHVLCAVGSGTYRFAAR